MILSIPLSVFSLFLKLLSKLSSNEGPYMEKNELSGISFERTISFEFSEFEMMLDVIRVQYRAALVRL